MLDSLHKLVLRFRMRQHSLNLLNLGPNIWMFAITGGAGSGKTSSQPDVICALKAKGYAVIVVPESATALMEKGIRPGCNGLTGIEFQKLVIKKSLSAEFNAMIAATALRNREPGKKTVILCDRGLLDGEAYVERGKFASLLASMSLDHHAVGNHRYHAAFHLRTAAHGAEEHYVRGLEKNRQRRETIEEARSVCDRTMEAWLRHHHLRVIDNSTDMSGKVARLLVEMFGVLGDPDPVEIEDKFLVGPMDLGDIPVPHRTVMITQNYLTPPTAGMSEPEAHDETNRVRMEEDIDGTGVTYWHTRKWRPNGAVDPCEINRIITHLEYDRLLKLADPAFDAIHKLRTRFVWNSRLFELDQFQGPDRLKGLVVMEEERSNREELQLLPPFIPVLRNVTGNKSFSNHWLARKPVAS